MAFKKKEKRPYGDPSKLASVTFRIETKHKEIFKKHAEYHKITMSALFRNLLEYLIEGIEE